MNRVIKGKLNKVLSIVLSAAMIIGTVSFLPQSAWEAYADTVSEEKGAFTVTAETQDDLDAVTYDSSSGTLTFGADTAGKSYTIKQTDGVDTATSDRITINGGTTESPVTIKLDGVNIDGSDIENFTAMQIQENRVVKLVLEDDSVNSLASSMYSA